MNRDLLSSALERVTRTFVQVGMGVGATQATGADLSTTAGIVQFVITTIVTALVMAYAMPAKQDVQKTPDPVFVPTTVNDALKDVVAKTDDVVDSLKQAPGVPGGIFDIPAQALDELRKRFGR